MPRLLFCAIFLVLLIVLFPVDPLAAKLPYYRSNWNSQNWIYHPSTQISALAQNRRAHPLLNHLSYLRTSTYVAQPQYLRKLFNVKPAGSTRSSIHLTLLRPSISPLQISNRLYNQAAPILLNNLPKSVRTVPNTFPNSATTSQCSSLPLSLSKTQFRSHLKHTFSESHTHLHLLSCSD